MLSLVAAPPGDGAITLIYVLIAIVTVFGGGGAVGVYKWAKKQGVRDSQLDLVIGVVLGDGNGGKPLKDRLDAQDRRLEDLQREARPNGGNTQRLGDTVKRTEQTTIRTEAAVSELATKVDQHIGKEGEAIAELKRRTTTLERRAP